MKKRKSKLTKTVKPSVQKRKLLSCMKKAKDITELSDADLRSLAAELLIHQIELELNGRELKRANGEKKDMCEKLDAQLRELANYKILISEINDLVYICDAEGHILFVNPVFEKLTGHKPEKFIGKLFEPLFDRENRKKAKDAYTRTLCGESPRYELCFKDTGVVCEYKNVPWKDKSGNIIGVMGAARDITEHQQLERMHAMFTAILETTTDFVGYADAKTTQVRYINKAGRKMVGIGEDEDVTGQKIADFHPGWANKLLQEEAFPAAVRDGVWRGECAFVDRKGHEISVAMVVMAHKDAKGRVEIFSTISHDISERKQTEIKLEECNEYLTRLADERMFALIQSQEELQSEHELCRKIETSLRQSESVSRGMIENATDGIFLLDDSQRIVTCNQQAALLLGYKETDELAGKTIFEFVSMEEHQLMQAVWQKIMEKGNIRGVEFTGKRKDGSCFPAEVCVNMIADQEGKPKAQIAIVSDIAERKRMEQKLMESEQRFRVLVEACKEWAWYCDTKGRYIYSNNTVEAILGFPAEEFMADAFAFLHEDDRKRAEKMLSECVAGKTGWSGVVLRWRHKNGTYRYLEGSAVPVFDKSGALAGYWGMSRDITWQKESEDKIKKLSAAIEQSVNIVFITDSKGQIEYINPMFERVTGYVKAEVIGQNPRILNSGETANVVYGELWNTVLAGKTWKGTFKNKKKDGRYYMCESTISPVCDDNGQITHFLCVQEDITERMELRDSVNQLAVYSSFDGLTGLYNRTRFTELLEEWVSQAVIHKYQGALLLIDIDKFRLINDTYGNKIGDDLLQRIAGFLQVALAEIDMKYFIGSQKEIMESLLCRMGGDEFAVFLPSRDGKESLATADEIRRRLESFQFENWTGHITISVGVVLYPAHGLTLYDLFKKADAAVFYAKELGRNRSRLYQPEDLVLEKMHTRVEWKGRIQKALREDRIVPWFQPIYDMKEGTIYHYEVLVRIRDNGRGFIQPAEFIDTAEAFGLIRDIDRVVIEKTLKYKAKLLQDGRHFHFSMNLSARDLEDPEFMDFLKGKVSELPEGKERIIFELTETAAVHDLGRAVKFIGELKSVGCVFSLDDFGVGFTSFKYLAEMSVDYIKIDGSFIKKLSESRTDRLFVKSMADVAKGMGIKTVAEFVENGETVKILKDLGVDYAQGYFIGKPAPDVI